MLEDWDDIEIDAITDLFIEKLNSPQKSGTLSKFVRSMILRKKEELDEQENSFQKKMASKVIDHLSKKINKILKNWEKIEKKRAIVKKDPIVTYPIAKMNLGDDPLIKRDKESLEKEIKTEQIKPKKNQSKVGLKYLKKTEVEEKILKLFSDNADWFTANEVLLKLNVEEGIIRGYAWILDKLKVLVDKGLLYLDKPRVGKIRQHNRYQLVTDE